MIKDTKELAFCPNCKTEILSVGWGRRVQCPECDKWITITTVKVPVVLNIQANQLSL